MAQPYLLVVADPSLSTIANNLTRFFPPFGRMTTAAGTEDNVKVYAGATGTLSKLGIHVRANTFVTNACTYRSRKNNANGGQSISIAAGTTGRLEDASGTDSLVAGDFFDYSLVTPTESAKTITTTSAWSIFTASTTGVAQGASNPAGTQQNSGLTRYAVPLGALGTSNISATETDSQYPINFAATLSRLRARISANTLNSGNVTVTLRKNAAATAMTASLAAGSTGSVEDTTNTASVVATDLIDVEIVTGGTTGNVFYTNVSFAQDGTKRFLGTGASASTVASGITRYAPIEGVDAYSATEADAQTEFPDAFTLGGFQVKTLANSINTGSIAVKVRKGGVDTALAVSISAGATGAFTDADTVTVADGDLINSIVTTGGSSGTIAFRYISVDLSTGPNNYTSNQTGSQPASSASATRILQALRGATGDQPTPSGTLARIKNALRALTGDQPASSATPSRILHALRTLTGDQPTASGTIARIKLTLRSETGNQPAPSATLARIKNALRSLTGDQPASSASVTLLLHALRTLTGSQPAASGDVTRIKAALRSLTGDQPAASGSIARVLIRLVGVNGSQPAPSGVPSRILHALRSLLASQPASSGTATPVLHAFRSLTGNQPAASASATRVPLKLRSVNGSQPAASGSIARIKGIFRSATGGQPAPSGTLARRLQAIRSNTGAQSSPSAGINVPAHTIIAVYNEAAYMATRYGQHTVAALSSGLFGVQGIAFGIVSRLAALHAALTGDQPTASGTLARAKVAVRALLGGQPAPSGSVARSRARSINVEGTQPTASGLRSGDEFNQSPSRSSYNASVYNELRYAGRSAAQAAATILGTQPASSGTLATLLTAARALTGNQPTASATLARTKLALRSLTGNQPTASAVIARIHHAFANLEGAQPPGSGSDTRTFARVVALLGAQPAPSGIASRVKVAARSVFGNQPAPSATVTKLLHAFRSLVGDQPVLGPLGLFGGDTFGSGSFGDPASSAGTLTRIAFLHASFGSVLTSAGVLLRAPRPRILGVLAMSGAVRPKVFSRLAAALTPVGTLIRSIRPAVALGGSLTPTGTAARVGTPRVLATAAFSTVGTIVRSARPRLAGTLISNGVERIGTTIGIFTGSLVPTGGLGSFRINRIFGGSLPTSGSATPHAILLRIISVGGILAPSGSLRRTVLRYWSGTLGLAGALVRMPRPLLVATLGASGSLATRLQTFLLVAGALAPAGAAFKRVARALGGVFVSSGVLRRTPVYIFTAALTSVGTAVERPLLRLTATLAPTTTLLANIRPAILFQGGLATAGALGRTPRKLLLAILPPVGSLRERLTVTWGGVLNTNGVFSTAGHAQIFMNGILATAGTTRWALTHAVSGALTPIGALLRRPSLVAFVGTLTSSGAFASAKSSLLLATATLGTGGTLARSATQRLLGATTPSATLARAQTRLLALGGTLTTLGTLGRRGVVTVLGTLTPAATIVRSATQRITGALTSNGFLFSPSLRSFAFGGTLATAGTIRRSLTQRIAGALTPTGSTRPRPLVILRAVLDTAGAVATQGAAEVLAAGGIVFSGAVRSIPRLRLVGSMAAFAPLRRAVTQRAAGTLASAGMPRWRVARLLEGTTEATSTLGLVKTFTLILSGALGVSGATTKAIQRTMSGALTSVGGIRRRIIRTLVGLLVPHGTMTHSAREVIEPSVFLVAPQRTTDLVAPERTTDLAA